MPPARQPSDLFAGLPTLEDATEKIAVVNEWTIRLQEADRVSLERLLPALDRDWRRQRGATRLSAAQYGRLLAIVKAPGTPLELTYTLAKQSRDAATHLGHAANLLRAGHRDWAVAYVSEVLSQYAPESDRALMPLLDELADALGFAGWVAYSADWRLLAGMSRAHLENRAVLVADGQTLMLERDIAGHWLAAPGLTMKSAAEVSCDGLPMLACHLPPRQLTLLAGRCAMKKNRLAGWVSDQRSPQRMPPTTVRAVTDNWRHPLTLRQTDLGVFSFDEELPLPAKVKASNRVLDVRALLPGAGERSLPDAPVLLEFPKARQRGTRKAAFKPITATPTVVIPVYNNINDSVRAIETALTALPAGWSLIVVDDASTDPEAGPALQAFTGRDGFRLLRNAFNGGYAAAVNRGIDACAGDVVLLNSDAVLFPGTLEHLASVAASAADIGTVTAASTDDSVAGIHFSPTDEAAALLQSEQLHRNLQAAPDARPLEVPTGVGHCLLIKRACLAAVGALDAEAFPAGYGEETDFCFRASAQGWRHVIATGTFVYHAGGRSFTSRRKALLDRGDAIMRSRYRDYARRVGDCVKDPGLLRFKRGLQEQILRAAPQRLTLIVAPRLWGGVDRAVANRCEVLRRQGRLPLVIHPGQDSDAGELHVWCSDLGLPSLVYRRGSELEELLSLLSWLSIEQLEVHHFVGIPFELIDRLVDGQGMRLEVFVHDYAWICPRLHLMGRSGGFCGLPSIRECGRCVREQGSLLQERIEVAALRQRSRKLFERADRVFAVSADIRDRLAGVLELPLDRFTLHALEAAVVNAAMDPASTPRTGRRVGVALMGGIGRHKGYDVLLACARDARRRRLPIDFSIVGHSHDDAPLERAGNVAISGPYQESEAEYLLSQTKADVFFCASIIPESWCYTLSYPLRLGMPVVSFDIGAQAERLRAVPGSRIVPLKTSAAELNDLFIARVAGTDTP